MSLASTNKRPLASLTPSDSATYTRLPAPLISRIRLRELEPFKGKTLKEARDFLRTLEVMFAISKATYSADFEKVLYRVMFLVGEPRKN